MRMFHMANCIYSIWVLSSWYRRSVLRVHLVTCWTFPLQWQLSPTWVRNIVKRDGKHYAWESKGTFFLRAYNARKVWHQWEPWPCSVEVGSCTPVQDAPFIWNKKTIANVKSACNFTDLHALESRASLCFLVLTFLAFEMLTVSDHRQCLICLTVKFLQPPSGGVVMQCSSIAKFLTAHKPLGSVALF